MQADGSELSGDEAKAALASADAMMAAGRRRAHWPKWQAAVDSVLTAVSMAAGGLFFGLTAGMLDKPEPAQAVLDLSWYAIAACLPAVAFRYYRVARGGVASRPTWSDAGRILFIFATVVAGAACMIVTGWGWVPVAVAAAWIVPLYVLRRRGRVV